MDFAPSPSPPHDPVTFDSPPVNEVALAVQFPREVIDEVGILSSYLPTIREDFPRLEKQPPLPPMQEDLSNPLAQGPSPVQFVPAPLATRYWFISEDETRLIQVQPDRFVLNWRQTERNSEYPRYKALRAEFERLFSGFLKHLSPGADVAAPNICEVTYINHVEAGEASSPGTHGPLAHILRALNPKPVSEALPPVEDTQLQQRFLIRNQEGIATGRLYLSAVPAFREQDGAPIYVLTFVARGVPEPQQPAGVVPFFDMGRDLIVRGFKESTTIEMHQLWGLHTEEGS